MVILHCLSRVLPFFSACTTWKVKSSINQLCSFSFPSALYRYYKLQQSTFILQILPSSTDTKWQNKCIYGRHQYFCIIAIFNHSTKIYYFLFLLPGHFTDLDLYFGQCVRGVVLEMPIWDFPTTKAFTPQTKNQMWQLFQLPRNINSHYTPENGEITTG